jgi:hypothetical protein
VRRYDYTGGSWLLETYPKSYGIAVLFIVVKSEALWPLGIMNRTATVAPPSYRGTLRIYHMWQNSASMTGAGHGAQKNQIRNTCSLVAGVDPVGTLEMNCVLQY